jgi:hypothetical protein
VATHPISNDEKAMLIEQTEAVFVVLALEPHIAPAGCDYAHLTVKSLEIESERFTSVVACQ